MVRGDVTIRVLENVCESSTALWDTWTVVIGGGENRNSDVRK
jgi:hypothetical protein